LPPRDQERDRKTNDGYSMDKIENNKAYATSGMSVFVPSTTQVANSTALPDTFN